jgi:hypothetical protein
MTPIALPGLALSWALALSPQGPHAVQLGVAPATDKLRPTDAVPPKQPIQLQAARGECESAQIAVRGQRPITLSASAPAHLHDVRARPGGTPDLDRLPAVALYRVANLQLASPSGPDGAAGEWPDPLIPVVDPDFGQGRNAFPVTVPRGKLQAVWVEICVPPSAEPGHYQGAVTLRDRAQLLGQVTVQLEVWPFILPATSSLPVTFGLSTLLGTRVLGRPDDPELARALARSALRHRITPHGLSMAPPSGRCGPEGCDLDFTAYDEEMAPILEGRLVPGVRGTFAEVRIPPALWRSTEAAAATLRAWKSHFQRRGWADRLWLYTLDEPKPEQMPELTRRARLAGGAGVRVLATTPPTKALAGLVETFVPNLTRYRGGERPGDLFWYVSCLSHGCAEPTGAWTREQRQEFGGWPGYEIDRPGMAARIMGWLAWREGIGGELYYDMIQAWSQDPWDDVRAFAGNGDGTLIYPGLPKRLGGSSPFPVESIRLKQIRDGLEDYELLAIAQASGLGKLARQVGERVVPSARGWNRSAETLLAARRQVGQALARNATGLRLSNRPAGE